ncbi:hypothetical protein SMC26_39895 [Actinomadura fulvescens]|uniref:DUF676 domain-containing protein n=1 Tax=Actinomadura fulvescens TaxID=46160 RepID=A0ABP6D8V6_9ACTN
MPRHRAAAALAAVLTAVALVMPARTASAAAAHDPVIIVPGMTGTTSYMSTMRQNFVRAGWPDDRAITWTDRTSMTGDLTQAGQAMGQEVDRVLRQTGAQKVILVTWSASTLAARSYLKHVPGAQDKVSHYFSMAGPHHGTTTASMCRNLYTSCRQFAIGSPWLRDLNSGTEVPGSPAVRYTTLRSTCDWNVNPSQSAELAGADNRLTPTCIDHSRFPHDTGVFNLINKIIQENPGTATRRPARTPSQYGHAVTTNAPR